MYSITSLYVCDYNNESSSIIFCRFSGGIYISLDIFVSREGFFWIHWLRTFLYFQKAFIHTYCLCYLRRIRSYSLWHRFGFWLNCISHYIPLFLITTVKFILSFIYRSQKFWSKKPYFNVWKIWVKCFWVNMISWWNI